MGFSKYCYNFKMGSHDKDNLKMGDDDDDIVEAIKEEVIETAKAVVADVKAIAHEVVEAIAEGTGHEHAHLFQPPGHDGSNAAPGAEEGDASHPDSAAGGMTSAKKPG